MGKLIKLTFDEVLPCLDNVKHLSNGEIQAKCPAHDDEENSFTMKMGANGEAVCNCFAKCSQRAIFDAINSRLGKSFTFEDDKPIKKAKKNNGIFKEVTRYNYTDEAGEIIDTKVRQYNSTTKKKKFYWVIEKENRKAPLPLFNLDDVIAKNPIFLVEGEKDALTLKNIGIGATSSKDGFTPDNVSKYLTGKDIIVIPDNDEAGIKIARDAADILIGIAKSIKMVELHTIWNDIPPKSDVTDYIEHGGKVEEIIKKAESLEEYKKSEADAKKHPHADIWNDIEGYALNSKNQLCHIKSADEKTPLCHGSIVITKVIYNNDGRDNHILYECDGVTESGKHEPKIIIDDEDFASLKWISKYWGCSIITFGTQSTIRRLVEAIMLTGQKLPIVYQKCHTGFVSDESGKPFAYLHAGGSIGNNEIICELDDELKQYTMAGCSSTPEERAEAFRASLSLLQAHRESVTYPLLSFIYMPALAQINRDVNGECGFCLYLRGKTQNGKSTLAALAMSHFGKFTSTTPPTSFESTWNRNELLSFILKDSVLWIDDFYPKGDSKTKVSQNEQFSRIARAAGDRAFRGRLNSNSEMKKSYPPRCLFLVTGEDDPDLSQSGKARIFTIDVKAERKDISNVLQSARDGLLSRAMCDYLNYIIENYDAVRASFSRLYGEVIKNTRSRIGENRLSIQAALLITSFGMWLRYAASCELLDVPTAKTLIDNNASTIMALAQMNAVEIASSDPAEKFIKVLSSMISNREVEIRNIRNDSCDNELLDDRFHIIGWMDDSYYYLEPSKAYSAVKNKLESIDENIGATMKGLYHQLMDAGKISGDKDNNYARQKNINGKNKRVIFFEKKILETV